MLYVYKILHQRPEIQPGGCYVVYLDLHWINCPSLDPARKVLSECDQVPFLMVFPYTTCQTIPPGAPPAGYRWAELFTVFPVFGGVPQTPIAYKVARDPNTDPSPAYWFSQILCFYDVTYADDPTWTHWPY